MFPCFLDQTHTSEIFVYEKNNNDIVVNIDKDAIPNTAVDATLVTHNPNSSV